MSNHVRLPICADWGQCAANDAASTATFTVRAEEAVAAPAPAKFSKKKLTGPDRYRSRRYLNIQVRPDPDPGMQIPWPG